MTEKKEMTKEEKANIEALFTRIEKEGINLQQAVNINKDEANALYCKGHQLYEGGRYNDSLTIFTYMTLLDSANPVYRMGVAASYHKLKKYSEALDHYGLCVVLDTKNPMYYFHMADCLINLRAYVYALQHLMLTKVYAGDDPKYKGVVAKADIMMPALEKMAEKMPLMN